MRRKWFLEKLGILKESEKRSYRSCRADDDIVDNNYDIDDNNDDIDDNNDDIGDDDEEKSGCRQAGQLPRRQQVRRRCAAGQ